MRKTIPIFASLIFLLALGNWISHGADVDLSGKWVGTTEVPDATETDQVTLILKKENGEYSGTVNDSLGMATDAEIENVEFKDNTLTFDFTVFDGYENVQIYVTLEVEGDTMKGYWESDDGSSAPIELERTK